VTADQVQTVASERRDVERSAVAAVADRELGCSGRHDQERYSLTQAPRTSVT
jgi:hypothetical protein